MSRYLVGAFSLCLAASSVVYASGESMCGLKNPSTLRLDLGASPETFDAQQTQTVQAAIALVNLYGRGYRWGPGKLLPSLLKFEKISKDSLTVTFTVAKGANWSTMDADGVSHRLAPVTSYDFKAGIRRLIDPRTGAKGSYMAYDIKNAEKLNTMKFKGAAGKRALDKALDTLGLETPDAHTLIVHLKAPAPQLMEELASPQMAPISPKTPLKKDDPRYMDLSDLTKVPISGAYGMVQIKPNDLIVACKNKNYLYANPKSPDRLIFLPIVDRKLSVRAWEAGYDSWKETGHPDSSSHNVDITYRVPGDSYQAFAKKYNTKANFKKYGQFPLRSFPVLGTYYMLMNMKKFPGVKGHMIRTAMGFALDRVALTKALRQGQLPMRGFLPPKGLNDFNYVKPRWGGVSQAVRNKVAIALLKRAGVTKAHPLHLTYATNPGVLNVKTFTILESIFRKNTGGRVLLKLRTSEWKVFLGERHNGNYQVARSGWYGDHHEPTTFTQLLEKDNPQNDAGYDNPLYDEVLDQAALLPVGKDKQLLLEWALELAQNDFPWLGYYQDVITRLIQPYVKGYSHEPGMGLMIEAQFLCVKTASQACEGVPPSVS